MEQLQTGLLDRILRFDGVSIVTKEQAIALLLRGAQPKDLRAVVEDEEFDKFNAQVSSEEKIHIAKPEPISVNLEWQLPEPHLSMDLRATIVDRAVARLLKLNYSEELQLKASERIMLEYDEIEKRGMVEFMKTVIYILDTFQRQNIVWGVGRGSSCACYILFILGLHVVDCVKFDVPMEEFFHD